MVIVENTPQFVHLAEGLGIRGVLHTDDPSTRAKPASLGLLDTGGGSDETI